MKEYDYARIPTDTVRDVVNTMAQRGWTVHTFNRNSNASVIDILFERDASKLLYREGVDR